MKRKTLLTSAGIMLLLLVGGLIKQQKIGAFDFPQPPMNLAQTSTDQEMPLEKRLVEGNTKFAFHLFQEILKQDAQKNVFISPSSVAFALAMTYNGASGETQQQMLSALELLGMTTAEINSANQTLHQSLETADPKVQLSIANSLWARQGFVFKSQFLQANQKFYDATVTDLDFADPQSARIINNWVSDKTNGKIPQVVERLQPDEVLFLINAIYFKGDWTQKFDEAQTTEQPFYLADGSIKQHPLMSGRGKYGYYENEQFQAVSLPYGEGRLSMYVFLPRPESNLAAFYQQLTPENWNEWIKRFFTRNGVVELPRFKMEYEVGLKEALTAMGMEAAFEPSVADFSGMSDASVAIDAVKHKTFVEVNEEGTEAAATTSVGIVVTSMPPPPFQMRVDRPFFCAIRDNQTGTILFMGSIMEPN